MNKLSKTSKLDNILSWSLQALETCPGSLSASGVLVDACSGCYATTGCYSFKGTKAVRADNKAAWQEAGWVDTMVHALRKHRYFRWFDSGDMYSLGLAEKMLEIMQRTPWVSHWLPTRMHKFPKFKIVLDQMKVLKNVSVRFSSDSINGEYIKELHGSVIIPTPKQVKKGMTLCQAYEHNGTCNGCRACYDKKVKVIAYPAHGVKMKKVIMLKAA